MEKKNRLALSVVVMFASLMLLGSCGKNKENAITNERNVPDSALTDSIPSSGEDEFQQDVAPQGRTNQMDSTNDSTGTKKKP